MQSLEDEINKLKELAQISADVKNAEEATEFVRVFKELRPQTLENFGGRDRFVALRSQLQGVGL